MPLPRRFGFMARVVRNRALTAGVLALLLAVPGLWLWPRRGVTAAYFANPGWEGAPFATRIEDRLALDTVGSDPETFPQRQFSVEFTGWLRVDREGPYAFWVRSDDGSTLWIGDQLVVDNPGFHSSTKRTGTITLAAGAHRIRLRYMQGDDIYDLTMTWAGPGAAESFIPPTHLFVERPGTLMTALTSHVDRLWMASWFLAALLLAGRIATRDREITAVEARRLALKLALAAASTVVTLLAVEGTIRAIRYLREDRRALAARLQAASPTSQSAMRSLTLGEIFQPSPYEGLVYELKPNIRGQFMYQPLSINSHGMRDFEYTVHKPAGVLRIAGLGDSSLFGWGVALEDSTLKALERRLNELPIAQKFEVLNFAVPTYNTAQEAELFIRRCLDFDPDIVILSFNTNDYDVPEFMKRPGDLTSFRKLFLFDLAYTAYQRLTGTIDNQLPQFDFSNRSLTFEQSARLDEDPALPDEYRYMVGAKGVARAFDKLLDAARPRGVPLLVFDVKAYPGLHSTYVRDELRDGQRELLDRLSKEKGFHFLNTYPYYVDYLKQHPEAKYPDVFAVSKFDSHPNPLAHSINATALFEYLNQQKLLKLRR